MEHLKKALLAQLPGEVRFNEPLRLHTSFRIGGPADVFVSPASIADLCKVLQLAQEHGCAVTVLGSGTNVLVGDAGVRGCVVQIGKKLGAVEFAGESVYAEAGCPLPKLAKMAAEHGLSGLEFAGGIPGTVGGAVVMNAGAHGGDISKITEAIQVVDRSGTAAWLTRDEMQFAYRTSLLHQRPDLTVAAGRFRLQPGNQNHIWSNMKSLADRRKNTQPLGKPCCGSVFQNPPGDFAGRLIEQCGLKGATIGGAMVSPMHANFIVNTGDATAKDVLALIDLVRKRVAECAGVRLELEVQLVGE